MVVGVHKRGRRGVGRVHRDTKSRPAFLWTQVFSKYNSFAIFSTLINRRRIVNFSVNVSRNRNKNLEVRPRGIRGRGVRRRRGGHGTRTSRTRARITRTRGTRTWWSRRWGRGNGDVLPPDYIQVRHKLIIIFNCIDRSRVLPWLTPDCNSAVCFALVIWKVWAEFENREWVRGGRVRQCSRQRIGLGHQYGRRDVMWKHSIPDSFWRRHEKISRMVWTATAQNSNKSFTHIEHQRNGAVGREGLVT